MPRCRCGSFIQSGQRCDQCALEHLGPQTDDADHECPDCGGPTSGEGAVCHNCRDTPAVRTDGGHAPGLYLVNATGDMVPLDTEGGEGDRQLLAEHLSNLDDPRPVQQRLAEMSEEIRDRDSLGECGYFGDLGFHTFYNPDRTDFGIGMDTAKHLAFRKTAEELWLDADIVEDNQGELSPQAVADEAEAQLDEFVGQFRFFEVYAENLREVLEHYWRDPGQTTLMADGGIEHSRECHACGAETYEYERCHVCYAVPWTDEPATPEQALARATELREQADRIEARVARAGTAVRPDGGHSTAEQGPTHDELVAQAETVLEATEASLYHPVAHGEATALLNMLERAADDVGGDRDE